MKVNILNVVSLFFYFLHIKNAFDIINIFGISSVDIFPNIFHCLIFKEIFNKYVTFYIFVKSIAKILMYVCDNYSMVIKV